MTHAWQRPGESPEPIPGRPASARVVDPEDDLTPVGYPGEFGTTTVIPPTTGPRLGRAPLRTTCSDSQSRCLTSPPPPAAAQHAAPEPADADSDQTMSGYAPSAGAAPSISVC